MTISHKPAAVVPVNPSMHVGGPLASIVEKLYLVALLVFIMPIWLPLCWLAGEQAE